MCESALIVSRVFYEASRDLDSQPPPRTDHVEACRPRGICAPSSIEPEGLREHPRSSSERPARCHNERSLQSERWNQQHQWLADAVRTAARSAPEPPEPGVGRPAHEPQRQAVLVQAPAVGLALAAIVALPGEAQGGPAAAPKLKLLTTSGTMARLAGRLRVDLGLAVRRRLRARCCSCTRWAT